MTSVSKPILGLLLSSVVLFALVFVELRGSSSNTGGSQGVGAYQSAINKAHQAVGTSNAANARLGAPVSTTPGPATRAGAKPAVAARPSNATHAVEATHAVKGAPAAKPAGSDQSQVSQVDSALAQHRVIGLLFYNSAASDDVAVKNELAAAATRPGVVKVAVPVTQISHFTMITNTIPVATSPTLVLIDRHGDASMIIGFADRFEIAQRLNALTSN